MLAKMGQFLPEFSQSAYMPGIPRIFSRPVWFLHRCLVQWHGSQHPARCFQQPSHAASSATWNQSPEAQTGSSFVTVPCPVLLRHMLFGPYNTDSRLSLYVSFAFGADARPSARTWLPSTATSWKLARRAPPVCFSHLRFVLLRDSKELLALGLSNLVGAVP